MVCNLFCNFIHSQLKNNSQRWDAFLLSLPASTLPCPESSEAISMETHLLWQQRSGLIMKVSYWAQIQGTKKLKPWSILWKGSNSGLTPSSWKLNSLTSLRVCRLMHIENWIIRGRQYRKGRMWKWGEKTLQSGGENLSRHGHCFSSTIAIEGQVKFPLDIWKIVSFSIYCEDSSQHVHPSNRKRRTGRPGSWWKRAVKRKTKKGVLVLIWMLSLSSF